MRRRLHLAAVLVSALFAYSCSWLTDLVVVNVTDKPVTVEYWLKAPASCDSESATPEMAAAAIKRRTSFGPLTELDVELSEDWSPLPATVADSCQRVSFQLQPRTAARVATLHNYSRPTLDRWRELDLQRLEISSAGRTAKLCGPAILMAFEGTRQQQLLVFNGSPAQLAVDFCREDPITEGRAGSERGSAPE